MAQSQAWKNLERETARYFRTKRRLRGADFSESDVEIVASVDTWLEREPTELDPRLVVECKYRTTIGVVDIFNKCKDVRSECITIVVLGNYLMVDLVNFESLWNDVIEPPNIKPYKMLLEYDIHTPNRPAPGYLDDYMYQCTEYINDIKFSNSPDHDKLFFPILCLAKKRTKGRVAVCHLSDIEMLQKVSEQKTL